MISLRAGSIQKCTWYSDAEQNAVVDDGNETQDTFGLLQLLGFQAQLLVAGRRHIGPVDHDLGGSPGEVKKRELCLQLISKESFTNIRSLRHKKQVQSTFSAHLGLMHFISRPYFTPIEKLSFEVHSVTDFGRRMQTLGDHCEHV